MKLAPLLLIAALLPGASAMAQQVYKCTDGKGKVTYSEIPCSKDGKQQKTLNIVPNPPPRAGVTPAPRNWEAENAAFRLRHAERETGDLNTPRPPAATPTPTEPASTPRHIIRRPNPDFPK